jgi:D-tyrosyl-tRNA(Tyr) deacylase
MRAVVQRVRAGSVEIDGRTHAAIGPGAVVLLGVARGDVVEDADGLADRISLLRIFDDAQGRMNESVATHGNGFLVISQFTLLADTRKGRRPSYLDAAPPEDAVPLYERFVERLRERGHEVQTGVFRANMVVHIENEGPVTILLDSRDR